MWVAILLVDLLMFICWVRSRRPQNELMNRVKKCLLKYFESGGIGKCKGMYRETEKDMSLGLVLRTN